MRNVILVHLESINYTHYQLNKRLFPTLQKWEKKSLSFVKYFSTATSTLMAISDLAYGGMLQNEPCDSIADGLGKYCYQNSFLDELKEKGYKVKVASYPFDSSYDVTYCNKRHFIGHTIDVEELSSYETYLKFLEETMDMKESFVLWSCNYKGHVSYNYNVKNVSSQMGLENWESRYSHMDQCVHDLMDILERKGLLGQTTVIFYGDHGDDLFSHGKHGGLMHAIEPYEALIHTPFWIYDSRFMPEAVDTLIDTTDIRGVIEQLLSLPEKKLNVNTLNLSFRQYSLARNVYAAQKVRELSFHKAYSLTDGKYLFMAGDQGMELFHIGMDAPCQHNLLDYFDFDGSVLSLNQTTYGRMRYHFPHVIDETALLQIKQVFYECRTRLMKEVKHLYDYAECPWLSMEIQFDSIRYGWEESERRQRVESQSLSLSLKSLREFDVFRRYLEGKKIVLYGAGQYGKYFYEKMTNCVEIVAWVDGNYENLSCVFGQRIQSPDCIMNAEFDMVFIAVLNCETRQEIKNKLMQMGVLLKQIC